METLKAVERLYKIGDRKYRLSTTLFLGTFLVLMWVLGLYYSALNEIEAHHEEIAELESRVADYEGCRNPTPSFNSPLRVNFSDGRVARVSYHASFMPIWNRYSELQNDEEILNELLHNRTERLNGHLQSKVFNELEVHTFAYVTHNRAAVSQQIVEEAKSLYEDLDYKLLEFNLWEICEVRALGSAFGQPPHTDPVSPSASITGKNDEEGRSHKAPQDQHQKSL